MTKSFRVFILLVMLVCAVLISALCMHYSRMKIQLLSDMEALSVSQSAWEETAARKEKLQEELDELEASLKKANISFNDAQKRILKLEQEIAVLQEDIAALQAQLDSGN